MPLGGIAVLAFAREEEPSDHEDHDDKQNAKDDRCRSIGSRTDPRWVRHFIWDALQQKRLLALRRFDSEVSVSENGWVARDVRSFHVWACGAAGSALPWHGRGRRFDPDQVHHLNSTAYPIRHFLFDARFTSQLLALLDDLHILGTLTWLA